jgi:hypothetical protein
MKDFDDKLNSTLTELFSKFKDQELQLQVIERERERKIITLNVFFLRIQSHFVMN